MLTTQLPVYHRKVAEFIESLIGIEGWTHYEALLAYRYQQAANSQKELFYTLRAAELAKRVFAYVEALNYCNRAYDLLSETMKSNSGGLKHEVIYEYQFEVLKLRQGIHFLMGNVELSHQDARALMPLADQLSHDSVWKIDALLTQPEVRVRDDRDVLSKGLARAEKALELSRSLADQYRIMNSLIAIASLMLPLGDYRWREHAEEALQLARQLFHSFVS